MSENIKLNLGCDNFKLSGFINIDINPKVSPDLCLDLIDLDKHFQPNSVDFIFAGHVFEHLDLETSQEVMRKCFKILKVNRLFMIIVPDYTKCLNLNIDTAERVIIAGGAHKILFNSQRVEAMLKESGFWSFYPIEDLLKVPYILVSNVHDPKPDPWQIAYAAYKL